MDSKEPGGDRGGPKSVESENDAQTKRESERVTGIVAKCEDGAPVEGRGQADMEGLKVDLEITDSFSGVEIRTTTLETPGIGAAGKIEGPPIEKKRGLRTLEARAERLNFEENLNKTILVPYGAASTGRSGARGRGVGFYCPDCDVTYPDNIAFVDHLNSSAHLQRTGQLSEIKAATLEDVLQRLEQLKAEKQQREAAKAYDPKDGIEETRTEIAASKRRKRKTRETPVLGAAEAEALAVIGISGFRSTKKG